MDECKNRDPRPLEWHETPSRPTKDMTIEEQFADCQARLTAGGIVAKPCDYFKAGFLFGANKEINKLNDARKQGAQIAIALGKYAAGYRPGGEGWTPEDQQALDRAMGGHQLRNQYLTERIDES
jgi:hypothetical protein